MLNYSSELPGVMTRKIRKSFHFMITFSVATLPFYAN